VFKLFDCQILHGGAEGNRTPTSRVQTERATVITTTPFTVDRTTQHRELNPRGKHLDHLSLTCCDLRPLDGGLSGENRTHMVLIPSQVAYQWPTLRCSSCPRHYTCGSTSTLSLDVQSVGGGSTDEVTYTQTTYQRQLSDKTV
jgi:hypothetical protein